MFVLQIDLIDITKRPLQITARLDIDASQMVYINLKLIGEELWRCHQYGITVYDCHCNKLREIRLRQMARSVAALDTKTVVIATNKRLLISSTSGNFMNVRVVKVCIFRKLYILKT